MFNKSCEIEVIRNMANEMLPKFDKYWNDYVVILSIATILDPRYKVQYVRFKLKKVETNDDMINRKVDKIVDAMKSLFMEYVTEYSKDGPQQPQDGVGTSTIATTNINEHTDDEFDVSKAFMYYKFFNFSYIYLYYIFMNYVDVILFKILNRSL